MKSITYAEISNRYTDPPDPANDDAGKVGPLTGIEKKQTFPDCLLTLDERDEIDKTLMRLNALALDIEPGPDGALPHQVMVAIALADGLAGDADFEPSLVAAGHEFTTDIIRDASLLNAALREFRPGLDVEDDAGDWCEPDADHEPALGWSDEHHDQGPARCGGRSDEEPRKRRAIKYGPVHAATEWAVDMLMRKRGSNVLQMWGARS